VHVYSDKPIQVDLDTKVSFVIKSWQVSEGGEISVSRHVNWQSNEVILYVTEKANVMMMKRYILSLIPNKTIHF